MKGTQTGDPKNIETQPDELELLTEAVLDRQPRFAMDVLGFAAKFGQSLGWHYALDITWVLSRLNVAPPGRILDAGGGNGLLQFILAAKGYRVVSADAFIRGLPPAARLINVKKSGSTKSIQTAYAKYHGRDRLEEHLDVPERAEILPGEIEYHCCDLGNLEALKTAEFDAVVSISALEHNPPENLPGIIAELKRVSKIGADLLLTISADAPPRFDDASYSWLLNEKGIARFYGLRPGYVSNFSTHASVMEEMQTPGRLADWLSLFHYSGGKNGMPWGKWAPAYLPAALRLVNV